MSIAPEHVKPDRPYVWTAAVLVFFAPVLLTLWVTLWRTPYPVSEAVALFEDAARAPSPSAWWVPETSYYRPLFYVTLWTIWHKTSALETKLALVRLVHLVPVALLVVLFIWHLRPRTSLEAAVAAVALAVLVGSPGFRDNLEIPLSYTAVGMPIALIVWMLLNREPRASHGPVIVGLTLVALGFKEQGLVLVPLAIVAWGTRAPGASRGIVAVLAAIAVAYVALRLGWRDKWPLFEQAIGLGFREIEPREAAARFGAFPYFVYAYSAMSTVANVLFAEPTRGVFYVVSAVIHGRPGPGQIVHVASSTTLTGVIAWWGIGTLRHTARGGWSPESRTFIAMLVVLLACGALSFNYSRDRLGGMAVVFYALTAFFALRAAATRTLSARPSRFAAAALALALLAGAWHLRAIGTIEYARFFSLRNQVEWLTEVPKRRIEFADRPEYLAIMQSMVDQGTARGAARPTRYPRWVASTLGLTPSPFGLP